MTIPNIGSWSTLAQMIPIWWPNIAQMGREKPPKMDKSNMRTGQQNKTGGFITKEIEQLLPFLFNTLLLTNLHPFLMMPPQKKLTKINIWYPLKIDGWNFQPSIFKGYQVGSWKMKQNFPCNMASFYECDEFVDFCCPQERFTAKHHPFTSPWTEELLRKRKKTMGSYFYL